MGKLNEFVPIGFSFTATCVVSEFCAFRMEGKEGQQKRREGFFWHMAWQPDPDEKFKGSDKLKHEYISGGKLDNNQPSRDNVNPVDLTSKNDADLTGEYFSGIGLPEGSNMEFFLKSASEAGFDDEQIDPGDSITKTWVGVRTHLVTLDQPTRDIPEGKSERFGKKKDAKKPFTLLVPDKILAYGVDISNLATASASSPGTNFHAEMVEFVTAQIKAHSGTLSLDDLIIGVQSARGTMDKPQWTGMLSLCDEEFLSSREEWNFENDTLTG